MDIERYQRTITEYEQLYSVVAVLDQSLTVHYGSSTLLKYLPLSVGSSVFLDLFKVHRPSRTTRVEDVIKRAGELLLLIGKENTFAVRGQLVVREIDGDDVYLLLGGPWFEWMRKFRPDIGLRMSDFSKSDPQLDMLFLMSSNDTQLKDLEDLAEELGKARDDAVASKKTRSDFFAIMSHEMRTPLNGVISAINLLEDMPLNASQEPLISTAGNSARHLLAVINNVLDFSKLEAGKLQLQEVDVDQGQLISSVVSICKAKASEKGLSLEMSLPVERPMFCLGDDGKLRQILINLVGNAIKFTDTGTVTLSLEASMPANGVCRYRYGVSDTGIGISEEDQKQLFDVFWTSNSGRVSDASTGLGLNISKQMVDVMGGTLQCTSVVGEGSEFWFELTLPIIEKQEPVNTPLPIDQELSLDASNRVLLVDDNATNVLLGKLMLEKYGISVDTAGDGAQAVEKVDSNDYHLVLMDISMPVMDGIEATAVIKAKECHQQLPIVALTAHAFDDDKERLLAQGMDGYLTKPIEKSALNAVLHKFLASS